jgi:hypothetical protein
MPPLDTALILRAMVVASDLGENWTGDQVQQNAFADLLNEYGLKAGGTLRDASSGGARTYEAQFRSLGLINRSNNRLTLTHAGEDLVNMVNISETMRYQILKYQYPSAYSMGRMVNIDRSIKIRPFIFLLKLAQDPEINGLSDEDAIIPVVFGRSNSDFNKCKSMILRSRDHGIPSVIPDDEDIRTSRTQNNSYESRINDIKDIANTFKNVLQGVGLIDLFYIDDVVRFKPSNYAISVIDEIDNKPFVDFINHTEEQATYEYGKRDGAVKDTRRIQMPTKSPILYSRDAVISGKFLNQVSLPASSADISSFSLQMQRSFNISHSEVMEALDPILNNLSENIRDHIITLSRGGTKVAEAFEKAVDRIFQDEFGFHSTWAGRKRSISSVGGCADVYVLDLGLDKYGIIDTKSMQSYGLPHADVTKMLQTYIPGISGIYPNATPSKIAFVSYISHLIESGATSRAAHIHSQTKIPVALCSAYGFNKMRENSDFKMNPSAVLNYMSSQNVVNIN